MQIDITKLLTNYTSSIKLNESVIIPENIINDIRLISLNNVLFNGSVSLNEEDMVLLNGKLSGNMLLKDDLTLEEINYPFMIDVEEIIENNQNILDITDILWQNILLEIPSKVRSTDEDITLEGDGWRVISEDKYNEEKNTQKNAFANLDELLKTKEDR